MKQTFWGPCIAMKILASLFFLLTSVCAFAVPAKPGLKRSITLTDGTTVSAILVGDEYAHCWLGDDGNAYQFINNVYQCIDLNAIKQRAAIRRSAANQQRRGRLAPHKVGEVGSITGEKRGLIILVNFSDVAFQPENNNALYQRIANEKNFSYGNFRGSMYDYFYDQSEGQFKLTFDVVGPVTVSKNQAYYGENGSNDEDMHPAEMVIEALKLADSQVNYADYDWNSDGEVEQIYVVYADKGEADGGAASTIWPHEFNLYWANYYGDGEGPQQLDGVWINTYACGGELNGQTGNIAGIGTMCHEFSHCLGYPDFYDIDYSGGQGMGYWDLMDSGSYNGDGYRPAGYTSYERWMAGWKEPIELTAKQDIVNMDALQNNGSNTYVIYNKGNRNEYFLLENRQKTKWDTDLPGAGLLILHVDYDATIWSRNMPNDDPDHQRLTWVPADNQYQYVTYQGKKYYTEEGAANDPFPYGSINAFGKNTTPSATLFNQNENGSYYLDASVENIIQNSNGTISFRFVPEVKKLTLTATPASGTISYMQEVALTASNPNAEIYCTFDGSEPTKDDFFYAQPLQIDHSLTLKAKAFLDGYEASETLTQEYQVKLNLTADVASGEVERGQKVTLSCLHPNAAIYYTLDGNPPSETSILYTSPISIDRDITLKAIAIHDGCVSSNILERSYTIPVLFGKGTEDSPYVINNVDELYAFAESVRAGETYSGKYIKLNKSIIVNDNTDPNTQEIRNWSSSGIFKGTFDGNRKAIYGLNSYMFYKINDATIKNLHLRNSTSKIVNWCENNSVIRNCTSSSGICYYAENSKITGCVNYGDITSSTSEYVAGICCRGRKIVIDSCLNKGNVTHTGNRQYSAAGIVGYGLSVNIYNCANYGDIKGNGQAGGIIGETNASDSKVFYIHNCYNVGKVDSQTTLGHGAGGIAGWSEKNNNYYGSSLEVNLCVNYGLVGLTSSNVVRAGGILGDTRGTRNYNCYCLSGTCSKIFGYTESITQENCGFKTEEQMKSQSFLDLLNSKAASLGSNYSKWKFGKDGFPILEFIDEDDMGEIYEQQYPSTGTYIAKADYTLEGSTIQTQKEWNVTLTKDDTEDGKYWIEGMIPQSIIDWSNTIKEGVINYEGVTQTSTEVGIATDKVYGYLQKDGNIVIPSHQYVKGYVNSYYTKNYSSTGDITLKISYDDNTMSIDDAWGLTSVNDLIEDDEETEYVRFANMTFRLGVLPETESDTDISQLDNAIYIDRVEAQTGETVTLSVKMKNTLTSVGCSFMLMLPEGLRLQLDEDGDVVYHLGSRAKKMSLTSKDWNNGTYNFALMPSTSTATISGNDDVIVTFMLPISDDMKADEYKLKLTKCLIQSKADGTTTDYPLSDVVTTLAVEDYVIGDVNGDRKVTPSDAIMILYHYFEVEQTGFNVKAADMDGNGNVTPADAIEALYIYFNDDSKSNTRQIQRELDPQ